MMELSLMLRTHFFMFLDGSCLGLNSMYVSGRFSLLESSVCLTAVSLYVNNSRPKSSFIRISAIVNY